MTTLHLTRSDHHGDHRVTIQTAAVPMRLADTDAWFDQIKYDIGLALGTLFRAEISGDHDFKDGLPGTARGIDRTADLVTNIDTFLADVRRWATEWLDRDDAVTVELWHLGQRIASVYKHGLSKTGAKESYE